MSESDGIGTSIRMSFQTMPSCTPEAPPAQETSMSTDMGSPLASQEKLGIDGGVISHSNHIGANCATSQPEHKASG
jgi:hypothetical protein